MSERGSLPPEMSDYERKRWTELQAHRAKKAEVRSADATESQATTWRV
ncbi:hypothetical protein ABZX12_41005 [Kribbella sp. NPDC003505]